MIFLRKNEGFKDVELPSKLEKLYFFGFVELTFTRVDFLHLSLKSRQGRQADKEDKEEKLILSFK